MKPAKDLFSGQAATYAAFRPIYPEALYDFLLQHTAGRDAARDCATGNGQVAVQLAKYFRQVEATDISGAQIAQAPQRDNLRYSTCRAEETGFAAGSFDLITVGTALHWFDFAAFYAEVRRVAKPGALFAAWAYLPGRSDAATDAAIDRFQHDTVGPYWDAERRYVDASYQNIPFPFAEIEVPPFSIEVDWTKAQLLGYLASWSAVQHYRKAQGSDPLALVDAELTRGWGSAPVKRFSFPVFLRAGRVERAG